REPAAAGGVAQNSERLETRYGNASPDMPRMEFLDDGARSADVIRIAMRQDEVVEAPDAGRAQDRSDDAIADVEGGRADESSGIDEQRRSMRQPDERRVALTDIEKCRMKPSISARGQPRPGLGKHPDRRGNNDQHRDRGDRREDILSDRTRSPMSKVDAPTSPPASTSSVDPCGSRMNAASP